MYNKPHIAAPAEFNLIIAAAIALLCASCGPRAGGVPVSTCTVSVVGGEIQSDLNTPTVVSLGCAAGAGIAARLSRTIYAHTIGSSVAIAVTATPLGGDGSQVRVELPSNATGWHVIEIDLRDDLFSFDFAKPVDVGGQRALAVLSRQSSLTLNAVDAVVTRGEGTFLQLTFSEPALSEDLIAKVSVVPSTGTCGDPVPGRDYDLPSSRILRIPCSSPASLYTASLSIESGLRSAASSIFSTLDGESELAVTLGSTPSGAEGLFRLYTQSAPTKKP